MKTQNEHKMTLEEYKTKHSKPLNYKAIKNFIKIFEFTLGVVILYFLVSLVFKAFEFNKYAGYCSIALSLVIYIVGFILPLIKLKKNLPFIVDIRNKEPNKVKKYNSKVRQQIAENIIDITSKTDDINWYSSDNVGKLAIALHSKSDKKIKNELANIVKTDISASSNRIIKEHAYNVGLTTAISQSDKLDTLFIVTYELNLIKELVYLYGFRPSDYKLMKIYKTVIASALTAYGLSNISSNLAGGVVKKISNITSSIPLLGEAIGIAVDSTLQGVINSSLTVVIGFQTKKYLTQEFKLQSILDDLITDDFDNKEEELIITELKEELSKQNRTHK